MSFSNTGCLKELEESTKWVPAYELIKRIKKQEAELRKEAVKIAKEKGEKDGIKKGKIEGKQEEKLGIAKQMKGYSLNDIIELTGLTRIEIERL